MPPKKDKKVEKVEKVEKITKDKKVRFNRDSATSDLNENILKNAPSREKIVTKLGLKLDDDETEKETEIEEEDEAVDETEKDEDLEDAEDVTEKDEANEDGELDDEIEQELDEEINDDILEDDLYEGVKPKSKKKSKKNEDEEEKDEDLCEYNYDEIYDEKKEEPMIIVENDQRITLPKLTKYEKVRLIGTRAKQISLGAKVMIKNTKGLNPIEIAKLELEEKMIPMKIKRILPDNKVEIWKLSELDQ
jgi:DNA-directed RNA polymerase I, II, and III subunit RPABC2